LTTIFVPIHDIDIYLTVLYTFTALLVFGVRHVGSQWTTWYQKIILLDDFTLKDWYLDRVSSSTKDDLLEISEPAILKLARQALFHDVILERRKYFFARRTKDPLVAQLAGSLQATEFLMVSIPIDSGDESLTNGLTGLVFSLLGCSEAHSFQLCMEPPDEGCSRFDPEVSARDSLSQRVHTLATSR
jgi:hypothetical protein